MVEKYIPTDIYKNVFEIPYDKFYAEGKKIILFDLDNTLCSYCEKEPNQLLINLREELRNIGYKVYILSNNKEKRVSVFNEKFKSDGYAYRLFKPFSIKMRKFINEKILTKEHNISLKNILFIGDQLLTDTVCCNKIGIDIILVKSLSRKSEGLFIKINRSRENKLIRKIKKIDPTKALKIIKFTKED